MTAATTKQIKKFLDGLELDGRPSKSWRIEGPKFSSPISSIYVAHSIGGATVPLAIKVTTPTEAKEQFEALSASAERLSGLNAFSVPRVFGYCARDGLLAMEWIDHSSLKEILLKPLVRRSDILSHTHMAGTWLAAFHAAAPGKPAPLDPTVMLNNVEEERELLGGTFPADISQAADVVHKTAAMLADHPVPVSLLHGDYKPANILLSSDEATSIDMAAKYVDPVVYDLAQFTTQMTLGLYHPLGARWRLAREALVHSFLVGYGWTCSDFPLRWMMTAKYIVQWAQLARSPLISASRFYARSVRAEALSDSRRLTV